MKRIILEESADFQQLVIGIASDEPIFKLCWEINESLLWTLKKVENQSSDLLNSADSLAQKVKLLLFDTEQFSKDSPLYEDNESYPRLEMALFEVVSQKIPKEIRAFRYILLLRSEIENMPEVLSLLQKLNELSFVISAIDMSNHKNIKQILP